MLFDRKQIYLLLSFNSIKQKDDLSRKTLLETKLYQTCILIRNLSLLRYRRIQTDQFGE